MRASLKFVSFCLGFCSADISRELVLDGKHPIHSILEDFLNRLHDCGAYSDSLSHAPLRKVTELRMRDARAITSHNAFHTQINHQIAT